MDRQEQADRRLEEALAEGGGTDPRPICRALLKGLRSSDPAVYEEAAAHYRDHLLPSVAGGASDPVLAWTEYGKHLAELIVAGRTVTIDRTGKAHPWRSPPPPDHLLLHLPRRKGRALLVGEPSEPSAAQRAAHDLLVEGRLKLRDP